jgi:hypothetical protein
LAQILAFKAAPGRKGIHNTLHSIMNFDDPVSSAGALAAIGV